jgi:hypothetical protein
LGVGSCPVRSVRRHCDLTIRTAAHLQQRAAVEFARRPPQPARLPLIRLCRSIPTRSSSSDVCIAAQRLAGVSSTLTYPSCLLPHSPTTSFAIVPGTRTPYAPTVSTPAERRERHTDRARRLATCSSHGQPPAPICMRQALCPPRPTSQTTLTRAARREGVDSRANSRLMPGSPAITRMPSVSRITACRTSCARHPRETDGDRH